MTVSNEPPKQAAILPIGETVSEVFRVFGNNLNQLASLGLWPVALSVAFYSVVLAAGENVLLDLLSILFDLSVYTLFAVAWHRLVLLNSTAESTAPWNWQKRHNGFIVYALIVNVIVYAVVLVPLLVAGVSLTEMFGGSEITADTMDAIPETSAGAFGAVVVLLLAIWYLFMRLSFVFPARAVDEAYGLGDSWRHTRGNGWRLMAISFITIAPAYIVFALAMGMIAALFALIGGVEVAVIVGALLVVVVAIVILALTVTLASVAFRRATGWVPGRPSPNITTRA